MSVTQYEISTRQFVKFVSHSAGQWLKSDDVDPCNQRRWSQNLSTTRGGIRWGANSSWWSSVSTAVNIVICFYRCSWHKKTAWRRKLHLKRYGWHSLSEAFQHALFLVGAPSPNPFFVRQGILREGKGGKKVEAGRSPSAGVSWTCWHFKWKMSPAKTFLA